MKINKVTHVCAIVMILSTVYAFAAETLATTNQQAHISRQLEQAQKLLESEQYQDAIELLKTELAAYADDYALQRKLGMALYLSGDEQGAVTCWAPLASALSRDALLKNNLAWIYASTKNDELKNLGEAIKLSHDSLLLDPLQYRCWNTLAQVYSELGFYSLAYECSVIALKYAERFEPETDEMELLHTYLNSFSKLSDAVKDYAEYPLIKDAQYWTTLANYEKRNGNNAATLGAYLLASTIKPDDITIQFGIATCYMNYTLHREAVDLFEQLSELRPNDYSLLNNLSWLYATSPDMSLRNGAKAIDYAQKALLIAPNNYHIWSTLSEAYYVAGDYKKALSAADATLSMAQTAQAPRQEINNYAKQQDKCRRAAEIMSIID